MMRVVFGLNVSLDGFMEGPNGELEWSFPGEELHRYFNKLAEQSDLYLYGRRIYELMAEYWPMADERPGAPPHEVDFARIWKGAPKIVFSRTLEKVDWNATLKREVVADEIRELKEAPGEEIDLGGAELAGTFMRLGLIDEYRVFVHPVVLGSGKRMFSPSANAIALRLLETRTFEGGVALLRYERAVA